MWVQVICTKIAELITNLLTIKENENINNTNKKIRTGKRKYKQYK